MSRRDILNLPECHDQQIHREDPDEDHLPESQITGAVMVAGYFRVAVEEAFPDPENVETGAENDHQTDAEDDSQGENGIGMLVDDGQAQVRHITVSHGPRPLARSPCEGCLPPLLPISIKGAAKVLATSPGYDSNAKGRNTMMNPEQAQQAEQAHKSDRPEQAENRNGAIDETGKVDRIRDILFGSQMRDYDDRFQRLDERLTREAADTRSDIQKRLEALETFIKGALDSVSNRLNTEQFARGHAVEKLTADLAETAKALELATKNLGEHANTEFHALRQQLLEQSKALSDEIREKHGQAKADLDREAEQIRGAMTHREGLAEMFSEVALRLKNEFRVPGA
jgi:hypothetical protein